ncbi:MAG TPA: hypothetical protein PK993_03540 [Clostridia bacterium]|nr:hypothetical protein [Clostridia bacterium]
MRIRKLLIISSILFIIIGIVSNNTFAATFNLDAVVDGNNVNMSSSDIALNALNILPGEADTSYINIRNTGNSGLKLYMSTEIVDENDLLQILEISILNSDNEELYKGRYRGVDGIEIPLFAGESETITVRTLLPETAGNEYQNRELNVRFSFTAVAEEPEPEPEPEPVTPETPKTNQSRVIIYSVLFGIAVIIITVLILTNKEKSKNKK